MFEVKDRSLKPSDVIAQLPEANVALLTKKSTDLASIVAVIYQQIRYFRMANSTLTILLGAEVRVIIDCNPIAIFEIPIAFNGTPRSSSRLCLRLRLRTPFCNTPLRAWLRFQESTSHLPKDPANSHTASSHG